MTTRDEQDRPWRRRFKTIGLLAIAFAVMLAGLPFLLPASLILDLARKLRGRPASYLRIYLFGIAYSAYELIGLMRLGLNYLLQRGDRARLLQSTYRIQAWWAGVVLRAACRIFDIEISIQGAEHWQPGPTLVLFRHASLLDTLLPAALNAQGEPLQLRYVLKRELLAMPCLDVAGNILPNAFVARDGSDSERERERVAALGRDLDEASGVLIYPEGTRFSERKLTQAKERLQASDPERAARLEGLSRLLPIRPGGALSVLAEAPGADIVIVGHRGLDGLAKLGDIIAGGLVGRRVVVTVTRHARAELPVGSELAWLDERWLELDAQLGDATNS